jgi:hypothetical protein
VKQSFMDQQRLTELLHLQPEEISGETPSCPEGYELVLLLNSRTDSATRERLERHLADCSYCRSRTTVLVRLWHEEEDSPVPETLMARAERLGERTMPGHLHKAKRWAAAAAVALTSLGLLTQSHNFMSKSVDNLQSVPGTTARQMRNVDPVYQRPTVVSPVDGSTVRPGELELRWTGVPGSLYYDIRLVDAAGYTLWRDRVEGTAAALPAQLDFVSGERYFVRVDAYLAEAKSVSSSHVTFFFGESN